MGLTKEQIESEGWEFSGWGISEYFGDHVTNGEEEGRFKYKLSNQIYGDHLRFIKGNYLLCFYSRTYNGKESQIIISELYSGSILWDVYRGGCKSIKTLRNIFKSIQEK